MHLFINALAASAGGGVTYIRNVLPHLAAHPSVRTTVAINSGVQKEFHPLPNVEFLDLEIPGGRRFWYEQVNLPALMRARNADVLLSTGNFALWRSPIPQVLLSRNSLYLSEDFYGDLRSRREFRMWVDTHLRGVLAKRSILRAEVTVAPSETFASELERWSGRKVMAIHHGFDIDEFTRNSAPFSSDVEEKLRACDGSVKLLFVSHYNYYRNFETLIRALPLLKSRLAGRAVKLLLTCHLRSGKNPGAYNPAQAARLIRDLNVQDMVEELGSIAYQRLYQLYARADVYVTPAYTETFAHPLVEAMSSDAPVVASDLQVHREICGGAARYFAKFSHEDLADTLARVILNPGMAELMRQAGQKRAREFSWRRHVEEILTVCERIRTPSSN